MTHRERLEARLERRREWAEKREQRAAGVFKEAEKYRGDYAFNTQPGHIPERARLIAREDRALRDMDMARHHESRATGLERQLDRSIFSDDDDAIAQLEARILGFEAERERGKRINAAWRKAGKPGPEEADRWEPIAAALEMTADQVATIRHDFARFQYHRQPVPAYVGTNLTGRITADKKRIEAIRRRVATAEKAEAAGGVLIQGEADYVSITFSEKPEREILNALKAAGFYWSGGSWNGYREKIPASVTAMATA